MNEILISGYYGFRNSGDDALLLSIIEDLKKYGKKDKIVVLSYNPEETRRIYGVKAISRTNLFSILRHMISAKLLISGGGTLIQDGTSTKSLLYYLGIILCARLMRLKVMLYSNGVGPLNKPGNRKTTRRVLNKVDLITLRDEASMEVLREVGVTNPKILLTADPAFNLTASPKERGSALLREAGAAQGKKLLGISVREWSALPADFTRRLAEFIDYAAERYEFYPVFLPLQPKKDLDISQRIIGQMKHPACVLDKTISIHDMLSVVSCMDVCVGMRLHMLIYAATQSVPIIGVVYDPKVSGFMDYARQSLYGPVEDLTQDKLKKMLDACMENYTGMKQELEETLKQMKERAKENARLASLLYETGGVDGE